MSLTDKKCYFSVASPSTSLSKSSSLCTRTWTFSGDFSSWIPVPNAHLNPSGHAHQSAPPTLGFAYQTTPTWPGAREPPDSLLHSAWRVEIRLLRMTGQHSGCARRAKGTWEPEWGGTAEGPWRSHPAGPLPCPRTAQVRGDAPDHPVGVPSLPFLSLPPHPRLTTEGVLTMVAGRTLGTRSPLLVRPLPLHVPPAGGEEDAGGSLGTPAPIPHTHT